MNIKICGCCYSSIYNNLTVFTENIDHLIEVLKVQTCIIFTIAIGKAHQSEIVVKVVTQ